MKIYTNFKDQDLKKLNNKNADVILSLFLIILFSCFFGFISKELLSSFNINKITFILILFPLIGYLSIQLALNFKNFLISKL